MTLRKPETLEERGYCERSGISMDFYREHLLTLPCDCAEPDCPGWQAETREHRALIERLEAGRER